MRARASTDGRQQAFDFQGCLKVLTETVEAIADLEEERKQEDRTERSKAEFYIEAAAACNRVIRQSPFSRAQIVDFINENWAPIEEEIEDPTRKPCMTLPMFNNYLSKPLKHPMPFWLVFAICEITESLEPLAVQVEKLGWSVISPEEKDEFTLGRIEAQLRKGRLLKAQYIKRFTPTSKGEADAVSD